MSTTFEIGRWPAAIRRAFSHGGGGGLVTASDNGGLKRRHRSGSSALTLAPSVSPPEPGGSDHGRAAWGAASGGCPAAFGRAFSHGGDSRIAPSSNTRAVKRGHRSGTSTLTLTPSISPPEPGSSDHGGGASGAPVVACTSRATP